MKVPKPWAHMPVTPALLRFRIVRFGKKRPCRGARAWTCATFRQPDAFHVIFNPETRPNHPNKPGLYSYILAHDWNSVKHPNGNYRIEVQAADAHGNRATSALPFKIRN